MTKRSIVFVFIVMFLAAAALQTRVEIQAGYSKNFELVQKKKEQNVAYFSALGESLFLTGRRDILEGHLNDAIRIRMIDFFIISYGGELVSSGSLRALSEPAVVTLLQKHPTDQILSFDSAFEMESSIRKPASLGPVGAIENFRFISRDLGNGWNLKVGINLDRQAFFDEMNSLVDEENSRMFIAASLLAIAIFVFVSRDLRRAAMGLRRQGAHNQKEQRTLSLEAEALQNGILGYEETVDRLKADRRLLIAQVQPSLRTELHSGKPPPYEFDCTMVRTDINNFSHIFRTFPTDEFLGTINQFFTDCSHIISRYHGMIHEFVGDEIIFYFKDEAHLNSFTSALSCVDEINAAAEHYHSRSSARDAYPFRVKSALAHGRIRFGPLLDGFALAGAPLIETTRVLSAVQEKNENTVHFDGIYLRNLHDGVRWVEAFTVALKGLEGSRRILKYIGHLELAEVLVRPELRRLALGDYRHPKSVAELLRFAALSTDKVLINDVNDFVTRIQMSKDGALLAADIVKAIQHFATENLAERPAEKPAEKPVDMELREQYHRLLASLLSSLGHLNLSFEDVVSLKGWATLGALLFHADDRVIANALETLSCWRFPGRFSSGAFAEVLDVDRLLELTKSSSARVASNSLIVLGYIEISAHLVNVFEQRLKSKQAEIVASARYAIQRIASHYREADPVYLRTQPKFCRLLESFQEKAAA